MGNADTSTLEPIAADAATLRAARTERRLQLLLLIIGLLLAFWGAWSLITSYPDLGAIRTLTWGIQLPPPVITLTPR